MAQIIWWIYDGYIRCTISFDLVNDDLVHLLRLWGFSVVVLVVPSISSMKITYCLSVLFSSKIFFVRRSAQVRLLSSIQCSYECFFSIRASTSYLTEGSPLSLFFRLASRAMWSFELYVEIHESWNFNFLLCGDDINFFLDRFEALCAETFQRFAILYIGTKCADLCILFE